MHIQERNSFAQVWRTFTFDTVFALFGIFSLFHFLKKSKLAKDQKKLWDERWGFLSFRRKPESRVIWIHAVSVGEVSAVSKFVKQINKEMPAAQIIFSTVTPTGQTMAESLKSIGCHLIYFPFDLSFIARRVLNQIRPNLVLLAETEIWPNFILQAKRMGIPVGIINGRLSQKSLNRYRMVRWLMKPVFQSLDFVLAQTELDGKHFSELGIDVSRIHVLGNMKFDQTEITDVAGDTKTALGYADSDQVLIAGSTHPGEEKLILETAKSLSQEFPDLKVLVAPRHPERAREIGEETERLGFEPKYLSTPNGRINQKQVLIVDRIGELKKIYPIADLVVMGGSFIRHGGQNPIEPALASRAILSGPNVFNFRAVYETLMSKNAVEIIPDRETLTKRLRRLLSDKSLRESLGQNANQVVLTQRGATERHVHWVKGFLNA